MDELALSARRYAQAIKARRALLKFYALAVAIGCAGLALIHYAPEIENQIRFFSKHILEEVGKAMLVAAILAISVDVFLKKRLASEFVRDVSPFIEGIGLPEEFQDEIACIRRMGVYRKNFKVTYRVLKDVTLPAGYVRLKSSVNFDVVNPTEEAQDFEHVTSAEHIHKDLPVPKITAGTMRGGDKDVKAQSSQVLDEKGGLTDDYECKNVVPLQAKTSNLTCWSEMDDIGEISDSDIFYLSDPTVDVTVQVEAPDDLDISVYFGHRLQAANPPRVIKIPPAPARTHTWRLPAAMIKWSSIYIEWTPIKAKGPISPQDKAPSAAVQSTKQLTSPV